MITEQGCVMKEMMRSNISHYILLLIRFASITINLGPTFLSGTMAANINHKPREPSCPLVQGPFRYLIITNTGVNIRQESPLGETGNFGKYQNIDSCCPVVTLINSSPRHYIINFLWITVNIICIVLTIYHLVKLYKDYTNPSADTVRVATLVTSVVCTDTDASEVELNLINHDKWQL